MTLRRISLLEPTHMRVMILFVGKKEQPLILSP
jgi:hypothetical protein